MKKVLLNIIIISIIAVYSLSLVFFVTACQKSRDDQGWIPLFDSETLNGWHAVPGGKWELVDGTIVGTSPAEEKRHGILLTDQRFKDFEIRMKFKALKGNSGLYFRVDQVEGEVSVNGFQAEIDEKNDIGGLYETGGRQWVVQPTPEQIATYFKPQEWNEMVVSAVGPRITVTVNGVKTAEITDEEGRSEGLIGLQLHGGMEMHVIFKDIEIRIL